MNLTPEDQEDIAAMPAALRKLLEAELTAGNTVVEVGHSFPAPPVGAYFKLEKPVTTRTRASGDEIDFYNRDNPSYSGEFTDAKRYYFILEPPNPPSSYPDMDAVRDAAAGPPSELSIWLSDPPAQARRSSSIDCGRVSLSHLPSKPPRQPARWYAPKQLPVRSGF